MTEITSSTAVDDLVQTMNSTGFPSKEAVA